MGPTQIERRFRSALIHLMSNEFSDMQKDSEDPNHFPISCMLAQISVKVTTAVGSLQITLLSPVQIFDENI